MVRRALSRIATLASGPALLLAASAVVLFSLIARLVYCGPYFVGWDFLAPAQGLFLTSTRPLLEAISEIFRSTWHYRFWTVNSLLYTLIPAMLDRLFPSEYWAIVLTFCLVASAMALTLRPVGLTRARCGVLLLAIGASPILLSFSLVGFSCAAAILPHAIALWMVKDPRLRPRFAVGLGIGVVAIGLSWNLYEASRSIFLVWFLAAILLTDADRRSRTLWFVLGSIQVALLGLFHSRSSPIGPALLDALGPAALARAIAAPLHQIFVNPVLTLPFLPIAAILSAIALGRAARFWILLWTAHLALFMLLGLRGDQEILSRRFVVAEYYSLVLAVLPFGTSIRDQPRARRLAPALLGTLGVGNLAQLAFMAMHFTTPARTNPMPLPFTYAPVDRHVAGDHVDWMRALARRAERGEHLLLLYNFSSWGERTTDPAGVLERLYLRLGHRKFAETVHVFGRRNCRYDCLPIRPIEELPAFLDQVAVGRFGSLSNFSVHELPDDRAEDLGSAWEEIRRRFAVSFPEALESGRIFRLVSVVARPVAHSHDHFQDVRNARGIVGSR